jgi:hypothetical protein
MLVTIDQNAQTARKTGTKKLAAIGERAAVMEMVRGYA